MNASSNVAAAATEGRTHVSRRRIDRRIARRGAHDLVVGKILLHGLIERIPNSLTTT